MPFELPEDPRTARRSAMSRWAAFSVVALLVAVVTYLGYVGVVGSGQVVDPPGASTDCRTPASEFGWDYAAINYDIGTDSLRNCPRRWVPAGTEVTTTDGVRIAGWYVPAAGSDDPAAPTVVLAHGHGSNKSAMLAWAELLHPDFNLVLFDFRNHGQSEASLTTVGVFEQRDVTALLDWLEETKGPQQIGMLGVSMGGAVAVNAAALDARVDALVLDSTHATLSSALQARLDRAGYPLGLPASWSILMGGLVRTGQDMSAADPVRAIGRYADGGRPVLIVAGGLDDSMGANDSADLLDAALDGGADAELLSCAEAHHGAPIRVCADDYRSRVLGFLGRTLTPAS